jgi:hypothetical protein
MLRKKEMIVILLVGVFCCSSTWAEEPVERIRTVRTRDPKTGRIITKQVPVLPNEVMMQKRIERLQQQWHIPDAQWASIDPVLSKVMSLRTSLTPPANFRNRALSMRVIEPGKQSDEMVKPGAEEEDIGNPNEKIKIAFDALLQATRDPALTDEQIAEKLKAYQIARQEVQNELDKASKQLCELLTVRQRAQLVIEGMLE